jgi:hypothetical protein
VDARPPELPSVGCAAAELADALARGRRYEQYRDLAALARIEVGERLVERRLLLGAQPAGEAGDWGDQCQ